MVWNRLLTGSALVLVGAVRLLGGAALVAKGAAVGNVVASNGAARTIGGLMALIAATVVVAGIGVAVSRRGWWRFGAISVGMLWADGILNGFVLYGAPQPSGQAINLVVASILIALLYRVGKAEESPERAAAT